MRLCHKSSKRQKISGVELKRRIRRTEKPGFLRRFRLKTGLLKIIYKSLNINEL